MSPAGPDLFAGAVDRLRLSLLRSDPVDPRVPEAPRLRRFLEALSAPAAADMEDGDGLPTYEGFARLLDHAGRLPRDGAPFVSAFPDIGAEESQDRLYDDSEGCRDLAGLRGVAGLLRASLEVDVERWESLSLGDYLDTLARVAEAHRDIMLSGHQGDVLTYRLAAILLVTASIYE